MTVSEKSLSKPPLTHEAREVLGFRLDASKSSVKKFAAILEGVSPDGRLRNQFKYYGAHTGRWSGRGAQPQNLPRAETNEKDLENLIRQGMLPTLDTLSTCIRPMIKAAPGKKLVVADLKSIEHRVIMWLSGCEAGLQIHRDGLCPYQHFATLLPGGLSYEEITKILRNICKPPVLGCGFGLGPGQERRLHTGQIVFTGLRAYAGSMGVNLTAEEAATMVWTYRRTYYEVVDYWGYLGEAFYAAVKTHSRQQVGSVFVGYAGEAVYIELPSGRRMHYLNPKAWKGSKGLELRFDGLRQGQWCQVSTWGGSLTENVVQAVARDVMVEGMIRAESDHMSIVGHAHDEIICEVDEDYPLADKKLSLYMSADIDWAPGLPLAAEGWCGLRYGKQ